jgi:hypothetical protein
MSRLIYDENGVPSRDWCPKGMLPVITTGVASVQSAVFSAGTTVVEVWSSVDGFITLGANPVATLTPGNNMMRIRAGVPRIMDVTPGQKLGIILGAGTGTAEVVEME